MLSSARKIEAYVDGLTKSDFVKDSKTVDAVVRNLEIIGEAANRLPDQAKDTYSDISWPQIIGLRHRVVHEYFGVDLDLIWQIVENDLPPFKFFLESIKDSEME